MEALIVDDVGSHRNILDLLVRRLACLTEIVNDGESAIAKVQQKDYDLIILDIKMPNTDGYGVLAYLNEHNPRMLHRTLVVSALRPAELEILRKRYEVPVIAKPFEISIAEQTIHYMLNRP